MRAPGAAAEALRRCRGTAATVAQVPLDISGTLANVQVRPDLQQLARSQLQQQLQRHRGSCSRKFRERCRGCSVVSVPLSMGMVRLGMVGDREVLSGAGQRS